MSSTNVKKYRKEEKRSDRVLLYKNGNNIHKKEAADTVKASFAYI